MTVRLSQGHRRQPGIDMRDSYYGRIGGEELPKGVHIAPRQQWQTSGWCGVPVFDTAIANLGERISNTSPCLPTGVIRLGRNMASPIPGVGDGCDNSMGHLFLQARALCRSDHVGNTRNSAQTSIMAVEIDTPTPV